jgi:hypothetical protein
MKVFWLIWVLTVALLLFTLIEYNPFQIIVFLSLFALVGIVGYSLETNKKLFLRIKEAIEKIDFSPAEAEITKIGAAQAECYLRLSSIESELEEYKHEQERKYRDVVRKVLDIDNKLNRKFKLLGEAVLELKKRK